MMVDVADLRRQIELIRELRRKGQDSLSSRFILASLAEPTLALLDAMKSSRGERWLTLTETIRETGRTRNFFEKTIRRFGQRCRLEVWRDEGMADRTEEGLWLISPIKIRECAETVAERDEPVDADPDDLLKFFTGRA